jgi:outer membrane biosynthesis protein TonB
MGTWGNPNPLIKPNALRRTVSAGAAGLVILAGSCLGLGTAAAAEPLVVDQPIAIVSGEVGQPISVLPKTLDFKLNQAVLLAMPLAFGPASDASEQFASGSPIALGTAEPGANSFSGREIAKAATPRLSQLGLPEDKVEAVRFHFTNLVSLGNSITVNVPEPEEEEPPPPPSSQEPPPEQPSQTPPSSQTPAPAPVGPPPSAPSTSPVPSMPSASGAPAAVSMLPPSLRGASLPWAQARYGQVPGMAPNVGDLARQAQERQRVQDEQDEIRAAGQAEALPTEVSERVALPVLIAAVSLAVVTAALVRAWVLRRH